VLMVDEAFLCVRAGRSTLAGPMGVARLNAHSIILGQYLAAFKMLKEAIVKCPASAWDAPQDKDKSWFKAQHALYWAQRDLMHVRGFVPFKDRGRPDAGRPKSKSELLEYVTHLQQQIDPRGGGAGARGFRLKELERWMAGLRHIQQHTGELYERLGTREGLTLHWTEHVRRKAK
ncbi:MAG TPA: hypothetical protein VIU39_09335, partial [Anaerolineales bacterium]